MASACLDILGKVFAKKNDGGRAWWHDIKIKKQNLYERTKFKMAQIYIVGHKNPDNDSAMAAYGLATLKNAMNDGNTYIACVQGELPAESKLVFDEFGIEAPVLKTKIDEGEKLILVDHNEKGQSIEGLEQAELIEIVDHHRIADISTASPVTFINMPWGSTATVIAQLFVMHKVELERSCAAALLSAILTDTVILKSPTTTDVDKEVVERLSSVIGVDYQEFGMKLFKSRGGDEDVSDEEICTRDSKEFNFGGKKVWIAQYETCDLDGLKARESDILAQVQKIQEEGSYDSALLLLTDILQEGSDFLCAGDVSFIEGAFDISFDAGPVWMPKVMSRKKQVAAVLIDYSA